MITVLMPTCTPSTWPESRDCTCRTFRGVAVIWNNDRWSVSAIEVLWRRCVQQKCFRRPFVETTDLLHRLEDNKLRSPRFMLPYLGGLLSSGQSFGYSFVTRRCRASARALNNLLHSFSDLQTFPIFLHPLIPHSLRHRSIPIALSLLRGRNPQHIVAPAIFVSRCQVPTPNPTSFSPLDVRFLAQTYRINTCPNPPVLFPPTHSSAPLNCKFI